MRGRAAVLLVVARAATMASLRVSAGCQRPSAPSFTAHAKIALGAALCSSVILANAGPCSALSFSELQKMSPEERTAVLSQEAESAAADAVAAAPSTAATAQGNYRSSLAAAIAEAADAFAPIVARSSPQVVAPLAGYIAETVVAQVKPLEATKAADAGLKVLLTVPPEKVYDAARSLKSLTSAVAGGQAWADKVEPAIVAQAAVSASAAKDALKEFENKAAAAQRTVPTRELLLLLDAARPAKQALYDDLSAAEKSRVKVSLKQLEKELQALR